LGTDRFIDYRKTFNEFSQTAIEVILPPNDCILLECTKFIPPIIPDDYEPPSQSQNRRDSAEEPAKKKRRVKAAVTKIEVPKVEGVNGGPPTPQTNDHHPAHPALPSQPRDTYRPAQARTSQPLTPRSILDQPGQRGAPAQHPFAATSRPIASPSGHISQLSGATPQSSWRPPFPTAARPMATSSMTNGDGTRTMMNGWDWHNPIEVGSSGDERY